ncbi:hypothetical protein AC579_4926 [Pseudocercospora musae]|uniref:Uncharacterized protein n=1 Tax=Pseudocercospora musae TaxID=113226 RepID=A0A139I246_9PEZI|nr:hypothetical protein AC579_4926 [Pseudocercospora musae]
MLFQPHPIAISGWAGLPWLNRKEMYERSVTLGNFTSQHPPRAPATRRGRNGGKKIIECAWASSSKRRHIEAVWKLWEPKQFLETKVERSKPGETTPRQLSVEATALTIPRNDNPANCAASL